MLLVMPLGVCASAKKVEKNLKTVVFCTSMECRNCKLKIMENVSFERGVVDLDANLETRMVTITFDENKTDTTALARSIRSLGFNVSVCQYGPVSSASAQ